MEEKKGEHHNAGVPAGSKGRSLVFIFLRLIFSISFRSSSMVPMMTGSVGSHLLLGYRIQALGGEIHR